MDLVTYDPGLPELPLLRGLRLRPGEEEAPRFDWAGSVIRLAQAVAGCGDQPPAAPGPET